MSIAIMTKVWGTELGSPTIKTVAMKLADCAADNGKKVYPSVIHIARRSEISERTVQTALKALRTLGILVIEVEGGGLRTTVYNFDLVRLDELYAATQAKWAAEDAEAAARTGAKSAPVARSPAPAKSTGAKSAPVQLSHPPGAAAAPDSSVNPKSGEKRKNGALFAAGTPEGDGLIPFSSTYTDVILEAGRVETAKRILMTDKDRIPDFTPKLLRQISAMGVNVGELLERYRERAPPDCRNPSGYLMEMAKEVVAQRDGVSIELVAKLVAAGKDMRKRGQILASAVDPPAPRQVTPSAALRASLARMRG